MPQKLIKTTLAKNACHNFEELIQRVPLAYMAKSFFGAAKYMAPQQAKEMIMEAWKVYLSRLPESLHYQEVWKCRETEVFKQEIVQILKEIIKEKGLG